MSTVISVENLGKKYLLHHQTGQQPYVALRDVLSDGVRNLGRKLLGRSNLTAYGTEQEEFWALRDVSFEVKQGDRIGIIGRNGAGKSTLLKILSRITEPTTGRVRIKGRVASLLEVGTGFHPELTGRENIYLNGAILGMHRTEIKKRFDEIVDFAGIEKFLDTPVKRYSSGMYVRLAFAVAAHLEPEILVVDEVLAVGDVQFQKKCLGKMEDVSAQEGRTVLFVSHNMGAINRLCPYSMLLVKGSVAALGESKKVVAEYQMNNDEMSGDVVIPSDPNLAMRLRRIRLFDAKGNASGCLEMCDGFRLEVEYDINTPLAGAHVICFIHNFDGTIILGSGDTDCFPERLETRVKGRYRGSFEVPASLLGEGNYSITVSLGIPFVHAIDRHANILCFQIIDNKSMRRIWQHTRRPGILGLELPWLVEMMEEL